MAYSSKRTVRPGRLAVMATAVLLGTSGLVIPLAIGTVAPAGAVPIQWSGQTLPGGLEQLNGVSSASAEECVAVGGGGDTSAIVATTDGGAVWANQTVPSGISSLYDVSSASVLDCYANGALAAGGAVIIATTDGGAVWTSIYAPPTAEVSGIQGISCASDSNCVAVGFGSGYAVIFTTVDNGSSWSRQVFEPPSGGETLNSVSCVPGTTECVAVGFQSSGPTGVVLATSDGSTWNPGTIPGGVEQLEGVSCATASDCTAVGAGGTQIIIGTTNGGTSWLAESAPSVSDVLYSVSCQSASSCVAVGRHGGADVIIADGGVGTAWSSESDPTGTQNLFGVSCFGASTCEAVGGNYNGVTFTAAALGSSVQEVSCTKLTGKASGTVKLKSCSPGTSGFTTASAPGSWILGGGGTLTWSNSHQTTTVSVGADPSGQGPCEANWTEYVVTGTVSGGNATYTEVGESVALSVCMSATGKFKLAPGTTAEL